MHEKKIKILISASGTAGHLIPAIDLADKLQKNSQILFAAHDISKKKVFPKNRYAYRDILSSPISKKNIISAFFKIFIGFLQSLKLLIQYRPNVVVGFGSYHSFPVILASYILRKKIVLFDSNIILGKVNKIFAKKAIYLCTQFERENRLKNEILVKPLPWKTFKNVEKNFLNEIGLKKDVFTILIYGGSQGSKIINENFKKIIQELKTKHRIQVIHIVGDIKDVKSTKNCYETKNIASYVSHFEKDLSKFYMISDLIVSRSGANSIAEQIYFEKPSILVPFKKAKDEHQLKNAIFMQTKVQSSTILTEERLQKSVLLKEIVSYLVNNKKKLCLFQKNIQKFKAMQEKKNIKDLSDIILDVGENAK